MMKMKIMKLKKKKRFSKNICVTLSALVNTTFPQIDFCLCNVERTGQHYFSRNRFLLFERNNEKNNERMLLGEIKSDEKRKMNDQPFAKDFFEKSLSN